MNLGFDSAACARALTSAADLPGEIREGVVVVAPWMGCSFGDALGEIFEGAATTAPPGEVREGVVDPGEVLTPPPSTGLEWVSVS